MTAKTVAVILLFFLSLPHGQPFLTKHIDGNSGLYFEDTGKVFFYSQEWKIVSNVNLTEYHNELSNVRHVVDVIRNHCEELRLIEMEKNASVKGIEGCGSALLKLNFVMADIDENDKHWLGKDRRTKRNAFIDLVSDDWPNDHSMFFNEFANMSANGMETSTTTDKQTTFLMSTLNLAWKLSENKRSIDAYVTNQLSQVHNTIVAARNGSGNAVRLFQLRTTIPDIISYQLMILNNLASKQTQYRNIMSLVGVENAPIPTILSTPILLSELNGIRSIVSDEGLGFPVQLTSENVHFLLHLSSPEVSLFRDQIFVTFKLPLVSKQSGNYFTLFKATSALQNLGRSIYSFIIPNYEVIAIDAHKERYVTLTVDDLSKCRPVGNDTATLCKQTSLPMSVRTSTECEIMILLKHQYPSGCNERYMSNYADIFIKVMQPNTWLVTMTKRSKVRYLCDGKDIYETVTQINGLLTIDSKCKFFADDVTIVGDNTFPKQPVREHLIGNLKKGQPLNETYGLNIGSEHFTSNHVAQVIGFGETEKLFRISYSRSYVRTMTNVTESLVAVKGKFLLLIIDCIILFAFVMLTFSMSVILFLFVRSLHSRMAKLSTITTKLSKNSRAAKTSTTSLTTQPSAPTLSTKPSAPSLTTKTIASKV